MVVEDEVTVVAELPEGERLKRSAEAVNVVDTKQKQTQAVDVGDVLAREEGVAVRRSGGLGSGARFSLGGLYDDQIRFFVDGVPLELTGYLSGIANIPVNLVERIEIYRGVVPVRLGADALGGAVNLVSGERYYDNFASGSLQLGSFGTYRATLLGRWHKPQSGFLLDARAFFDSAENNYRIDVEVPDELGRLQPATVERFHDAYLAYGGSVELGFVERPWAKRLLLRLYASQYDKELQHNALMTVPYGEATYGEQGYGGTLRYEGAGLLGKGSELSLLTSVGYRQIDFVDRGEFVYDWFGQQILQRPLGGEISNRPTDQSLWQWGSFSRAYGSWELSPNHVIRVASTAYFATRTGDERIETNPGGRDPLTAERDLFTLTSGVEHQLSLFDGRLENVLFGKNYLFYVRSEEVLPGFVFQDRSQNKLRFGVGDALRYKLEDWLWAKVSYEYATRLPNPDEIFGNGVLILPNLELAPEVSLNSNYGVQFDLSTEEKGRFTGEVNFFRRESDQLIVLLGNALFFQHHNVFEAVSKGVELSGGWTSPEGRFSLDANTTYQSVRNVSTDGAFADFAGDRIPNRPWYFANASATWRRPNLIQGGDALSLSLDTRYVHKFFRGWESQGLAEFKQFVPSQLTHGARAGYQFKSGPWKITSSLEVQNLTNAKVFDVFGVQRPGRAVFFKITTER